MLAAAALAAQAVEAQEAAREASQQRPSPASISDADGSSEQAGAGADAVVAFQAEATEERRSETAARLLEGAAGWAGGGGRGGSDALAVLEHLLLVGGRSLGEHSLNAAAHRGLDKVTRVLLRFGGKELRPAEVGGSGGITCLHHASLKGHGEVVRALVEWGGKELVMARDRLGRSCLYYGIKAGCG